MLIDNVISNLVHKVDLLDDEIMRKKLCFIRERYHLFIYLFIYLKNIGTLGSPHIIISLVLFPMPCSSKVYSPTKRKGQ
jgi:hypothetical protein